jgi:hypothetical protein
LVIPRCGLALRSGVDDAERMLTVLIPKVFYSDIAVGFDLFIDGLRMRVIHEDGGFVVAERDQIKVYLVQDREYAAKDRPELSIETDDIEEVYADIAARRPDLLHPNLNRITRQPWGPLEFAVLDATTVCVVFRQWST